jgi:hypothetical protein
MAAVVSEATAGHVVRMKFEVTMSMATDPAATAVDEIGSNDELMESGSQSGVSGGKSDDLS